MATSKQQIVINVEFGSFGISDAAYERLIELGVPVRKYIEQERDPETMLYKPQPLNEGEVIFDRELSESSEINDMMLRSSRYWDTWIANNRTHPLLIQVVKELGDKANGKSANLKIVEIPAGIDWEIENYDGVETIHEVHRSWS